MSLRQKIEFYRSMWKFANGMFRVRNVCNNLRMSYDDQMAHTWLYSLLEGNDYRNMDFEASRDAADSFLGGMGSIQMPESAKEAIIRLYEDPSYRQRMIDDYSNIVRPRVGRVQGLGGFWKSARNNPEQNPFKIYFRKRKEKNSKKQ